MSRYSLSRVKLPFLKKNIPVWKNFPAEALMHWTLIRIRYDFCSRKLPYKNGYNGSVGYRVYLENEQNRVFNIYV
jgi:hypothetical protein